MRQVDWMTDAPFAQAPAGPRPQVALTEKFDALTVKDYRAQLLREAVRGTKCACCGQVAKVYRRRLYSEMAAWLMWAVREFKRDPRWLSIDECPFVARGGDTAKLAYWDLIEEMPKDPGDKHKRTSGRWRPTKKGVEFAQSEITVPSHVIIYNSEALGFSSERTAIRDALGKTYDYDALMRGEW